MRRHVSLTKKQTEVLNKLKHYQGSKKTSTELGVSNRVMRDCVHKLRVKGYPICSDKNGYWYGYDVQDVIKTKEWLQHRAQSILETCEGLQRYIKKCGTKKEEY